MTEHRDKILERAQRLYRMTGSPNENEALVAAQKLAELQTAYEISMQDLSAPEKSRLDPITSLYTETRGRRTPHKVVELCGSAIAQFTDTKAWLRGPRTIFFGRHSDAIMAKYLAEMLVKTGEREYKDWLTANPRMTARGAFRPKNAFLYGFCARINHRLQRLKAAQTTSSSTGTDLMVLKRELVEEEFAKLNLNLRDAKSQTVSDDKTVLAAGFRAGGHVNLSRPVSKANDQLQLRSS